MTIDEIKELIRVLQETGIQGLEVRRGENSVRIWGSVPSRQEIVIPVAASVQPANPSTPVAAAVKPEASVAPAPAEDRESERDIVVKSPIVGTYYDAPTPGAPPFVKNGDAVEPKQVICIIESMKLMNEIEAETAGIVVAKHVENGRPVEYGESLFTIRPR
jgi:acetyl-CoA carboxylase biotin carboxyl carrier protein